MKFHLTVTDEVDVGILHDTLIHLIKEHSPLAMEITVQIESPSHEDSAHEDSESSRPQSPGSSSLQEVVEISTDSNEPSA